MFFPPHPFGGGCISRSIFFSWVFKFITVFKMYFSSLKSEILFELVPPPGFSRFRLFEPGTSGFHVLVFMSPALYQLSYGFMF